MSLSAVVALVHGGASPEAANDQVVIGYPLDADVCPDSPRTGL